MALITAAEARVFIPGLSGTAEDTLLDTLIAEAGALIAEFCCVRAVSATVSPTLESTTYTLYGGDGVTLETDGDDGAHLSLHVPPVTSITSIYDSTTWAYGSGDLVASSSYVLDGPRSRVLTAPTGAHSWVNRGRGRRVICVAGYATAPSGLKYACGELVSHLWTIRYVGQAVSVSAGGSSIQLPDGPIPPAIVARLMPFRLMGRVAA